MIRKHSQLKQHHLAGMTDEALAEQARLAEDYAKARPATDLDGYSAAMRDAEACRKELKRRHAR